MPDSISNTSAGQPSKSAQWRTIVGSACQMISDAGQVRWGENGPMCPIVQKGPKTRVRNYVKIVGVDGVSTEKGVARMVLEAFVGPPNGSRCLVLHLNGRTLDDRLESLRWGTQEESRALRSRREYEKRKIVRTVGDSTQTQEGRVMLELMIDGFVARYGKAWVMSQLAEMAGGGA